MCCCDLLYFIFETKQWQWQKSKLKIKELDYKDRQTRDWFFANSNE